MTRRLGIAFWASVAWLVALVLVAALAPLLPLPDPEANQMQPGFLPPYRPSADHLLGTDQDARDVLSRTIYGARVSLTVGLVSMACGLGVGGALGVLAGYRGAWADRVISFLFVCLLSFPSLVLAIVVTALVERGVVTIALTLGLLAVAPVGQVARASAMSIRQRDYITASRAAGARDLRVMVREVVPGVLAPMASLGLLGIAVAIVAEGGLAFLGLSVEDGATWGKLILGGSGRTELQTAPWIAMTPIVAMLLTVLAFNIAGERLRSLGDARESAL